MRAAFEAGDARGLLLGMAAPEQEHDGIGAGGDGGHGGVGEGFPALALVRTGLSGLDRQRIVEQEHALLRPVDEMAMGGPGQAEVGAQFLENVDEAGRHLDAGLNRKRQAVGLSGAMIGSCPRITTLTCGSGVSSSADRRWPRGDRWSCPRLPRP
jgi:hypothetical protein